MLSYFVSFFNYITGRNEENDNDNEDFLAGQILELVAEAKKDEDVTEESPAEIPRSAVCFQRTGIITDTNDDYVLIDGMLYFNLAGCSLNLNINDKVLFLGYKDKNDSVVVVRILENLGMSWGEEEESEEDNFTVIEHVIVGEVDCRQDRLVFIKDSDLKFDLDNVEGTFVPIKGDWLEITCTVQFDENKPSDISMSQVLQVTSFKPLRRKIKNGVITHWSGDSGTCDRQIFINKSCIQNGDSPQVGSKVVIEAIESNQGSCAWRAIKMISIKTKKPKIEESQPEQCKEEELSLNIEKNKNISFTYPIKFDNVNLQETAKTTATITNNSDQIHIINKWIILSKKRDSQVNIKPFLTRPVQLHPNQSFNFTIECCPKFLGNTKECLIILFRGFQLKRFIYVGITNDFIHINNDSFHKTECNRIEIMRNLRRNTDERIIPGVRPIKPPNFIPVRLGHFPIPDKIWSAVLGDSNQTMYNSDINKILHRIEKILPCLGQDLNIGNYIDKWHSLLFMEEIQANINMRVYDAPKTFLIRYQEYLAIEIKGLSEKRPSLLKGDRVIVKDIWASNASKYEGYIHVLKGDLVLMKFNPIFHETYSGSDVSIEFHSIRSIYRRAHQAINLALSNLGPDILFPSKITKQDPQVTPEALQSISWFNEKLNEGQKSAITNILLAEARPMPYCIFGPPGTGKTVTIIETILQILNLLPDSRILVATPSNSAANLITQRLLTHRKSFSSSMVRLIANYLLDSDAIPDDIKPFCATLDIAQEDTSKSNYTVKDGINLNCKTSFIGRHRVTIGTCFCIGTLSQMGLPRGHFTHVIVDEAGQAIEPEIMIPLTFIDKNNGQIILAGDPMQLGPVIMSKYCKEFGMDESYFSRILETFPYHKDYDAFENGFNQKLVTLLNENYRSLEEVLKLPSEMFYNSALVPKLDRNEPKIKVLLKVMSELFDSETHGGIYVYGIRGCNARAEDSPSWYNPHEASMVALTTCKLYKRDVSADDIGIITPYVAQVNYLRLLFDSMGLPQPKIASVEEFQGQERPIILISTVRSSESLVNEDIKHKLGFVKSPKRLNVALTRAQVAVILFCNPHLLCIDLLWNKVIKRAVNEDKYMGCDIPESLSRKLKKNE